VFTKIDKLSKSRFQSIYQKHKRKLKEDWESLPEIFFTSAEKATGREKLLDFIAGTI
jgi:GTP-binding protein